ncbi:hypothetical protein [Spirosoma litoris]
MEDENRVHEPTIRLSRQKTKYNFDEPNFIWLGSLIVIEIISINVVIGFT